MSCLLILLTVEIDSIHVPNARFQNTYCLLHTSVETPGEVKKTEYVLCVIFVREGLRWNVASFIMASELLVPG